MELPFGAGEYLDLFWKIRGICGDEANPVTPGIITQWERHDCRTFQKWERECFFDMDKALRQTGGEVLKFHMERPQYGGKDKDKDALNGRRNPRL